MAKCKKQFDEYSTSSAPVGVLLQYGYIAPQCVICGEVITTDDCYPTKSDVPNEHQSCVDAEFAARDNWKSLEVVCDCGDCGGEFIYAGGVCTAGTKW